MEPMSGYDGGSLVVVCRVFLVEDAEKIKMMITRNARIKRLKRNAIFS